MQEDVYIGYTALALTLRLQVLSYTGATRRVDCLAPPSACHIKTETSRSVSCPRTQQANLPACSPRYPYLLSAKLKSSEYSTIFFKCFGMTRFGK